VSSIVPRPQPVPAPPPGAGEIVRRGARLGLGALGLATRAAGTLLAQVPDPAPPSTEQPGALSLLPGAVVGLAIEAERRASAMVVAVSERTAEVADRVPVPGVVHRALRPVEDTMWRLNEVARREQQSNQAQAAALIPVIVNQVTENVLAQLDFVRIVQQVPLDDIVSAIDIEEIVARVDLGGVIRESTAGLTMETVDALRTQGIALDEFASRLVDKLLFRGRTRDVTIGDATDATDALGSS
jgi:hypothetical protein